MCRLMAYIGPPRLIADVVLWPDRSIIKQSYDARERLQDPSLPNHLGFGNLNGDGFGIGWYTPDDLREGDPTPCMYKSITPAWNNENLARLSCKIISPLVFAHVRAAYPGMPVSEQNCHPFQWGRYIWMHNGVVGGFQKIKRKLLEQLSDAAYNSVQSFHSDSAVSFAVFLNQLPDLVHQQSPDVLVTAMQNTISAICAVQDQLDIQDVSLLNFVVSDGSTLIATRVVRPETEGAATLYYAEGGSFDRQEQQAQHQHDSQNGTAAGLDDGSEDEPPAGSIPPGDDGCTVCGGNNLAGSSVLREASYNISYRERGARVAFVASEPITGSTTDWVAVPKNTVLVVTREKGGFLSMLQSSLSQCKTPDCRLQEVSMCLASIAQGVHTKSRAWIARRTPQQLQQQDGLSRTSTLSQTQSSSFGMFTSGELAGAEADGAGSLVDGLLGMARTTMGGAEPETISMEEEHLLTGHTRSVLALVLDEPRGRLYSSSTDATVRAWDLADMNCLAVIRGHSKPVSHLQLLGGRLLFTAAGGGIRVWCTKTFVCLAKIKTSFYSGAIRSMLVADDGTIYVGHQDTTVKKYLPINPAAAAEAGAAGGVPLSPRTSTAGGGPVRQPDAQTDLAKGHVGQVNALVACGPYICSAGGDTTVRVWRASDLSFVRVLRGHRGSILCLLAVGNLLLSGSRDNTIRVWDLDLDFMCRRTLIGHKDDVVHLDALGIYRGNSSTPATSAMSSPAARSASPGPLANPVLVASASADGTVRVWSSNWTCLRILTICAPCAEFRKAELHQQQWQEWSDGVQEQQQTPQQTRSLPGAAGSGGCGSNTVAAAAAALLNGGDSRATAGDNTAGQASNLAASNGINGSVAVVGFANGPSHEAPTAEQQQQHQLHQRSESGVEYSLRNSRVGSDSSSALTGPELELHLHGLKCHTSFNGWGMAQREQQQQQQEIQQHQQQHEASGQGSGKQRQGYQRHRQRHRAQRHQLTPATAALVVAMSTHHVVGGYSDASIRLWHMDDVYLADLTEQIVSGQIQQSDLMLWQEQLRPIASRAGSFHPFSILHTAGSMGLSGRTLSSSNMAAAAASMVLSSPRADLLCASPPLSPTGLAGQLASQLMTGQLAAPGQLFSEGSGIGVEVLAAEWQRQRGAWCARLRDAGCGCGSVGASVQSSPALQSSFSGSLQSPSASQSALGGVVHCLACGSQDQQLIRALKEFVAIRSVSAHKVFRDECLRGAKYLSRLLEALGAEVKMAQPYEGKNPVVMGRLGHNPAYPTVAFYGHYDVQPAEEPDWKTNPFEMCAVDGYLCGRGTSDNKGPILAFIYAVKEMLDCWRVAGAAAPINVAFMFEGEEENGSQGFQESIAANLDWFSDAVLVVISNTVWVGENKPCLTYGMRGMVTASLVVSGPERDLHSGNDGGVFSEPMADLVQLLGSLHGPGGKISVPGFYNSVRPQLMDLAWQGLEHSEEFSMKSYREAIGVPELTAPPNTYDLLHKRWCLPSLSIVDVRTATSSRPALAAPGTGVTTSSSSSKPSMSPRQRAYAHSPAAAGHAASPKHLGCPHMHHNDGNLWPSVVHVSHTEKHAGTAAAGADERSCYRFGPTRFSVIPKVAVGKISLRFVPEQDHQTLIECLQHHIQLKFKQLWSANKVELQVHSVGDWWEADPQSQLFQMAERAVRREWGVQPLYVREGGTMPVASLIEKMLGAPALMIPMGQSSDNCHLANERLRRLNLIKGKNVVRHLLEEVAAAAAPVAGPTQQPMASGDHLSRPSTAQQQQQSQQQPLSPREPDAVVVLAAPVVRR